MTFPNLNEKLFSIIILEFHRIASPLWSIQRKSLVNIISDVAIDLIIIFQNLLWVTFIPKTSLKSQFWIHFLIENFSMLLNNFIAELFMFFNKIFVDSSEVLFIKALSFESSDTHVVKDRLLVAAEALLIHRRHVSKRIDFGDNVLV